MYFKMGYAADRDQHQGSHYSEEGGHRGHRPGHHQQPGGGDAGRSACGLVR